MNVSPNVSIIPVNKQTTRVNDRQKKMIKGTKKTKPNYILYIKDERNI